MELSTKANQLLIHFHNKNKKHGHLYSYESQETILRKLAEEHSVHICRRTLNYRLKEMENSGLIRRIRRHRRSRFRGMEFHSTLYEITVWGYNLLWRAMVISKAAFLAIKNAISGVLSEKKKPCAKKLQTHGFQCNFKGLVTGFIDSG